MYVKVGVHIRVQGTQVFWVIIVRHYSNAQRSWSIELKSWDSVTDKAEVDCCRGNKPSAALLT